MVYSLIFIILAAICNAVMDACSHYYYRSIFTRYSDLYWNADRSWLNKYIDRSPEKGFRKIFLGFNYPVFLTDAWHLFKSLMIVFLILSITFAWSNNPPFITTWWFYLVIIIVLGTIWNVVFNLFYNHLLIKK